MHLFVLEKKIYLCVLQKLFKGHFLCHGQLLLGFANAAWFTESSFVLCCFYVSGKVIYLPASLYNYILCIPYDILCILYLGYFVRF